MKLFQITAVTLAAALPMMAVAQTSSTSAGSTAGATGMGESGAATAESKTAAPATTTAAPAATTTTAAPAATTTAPAATETVVMPVYVETFEVEDVTDDAKVEARLTEAGYTDIKMVRDGNKLTIDATKDGTPQNLVYDVTTGTLTTVDGAGYKVGGGVTDQTGDKESTAVQH